VATKPKKDPRSVLLARIHIAQMKLWSGKEIAFYREKLREMLGVDSSAVLDLDHLRIWADFLESQMKAASLQPAFSKRPSCPPEKQHLIKKILAVLINTPGIKKPGQDLLEYADATASEMFYRGQNILVRVELLNAAHLRKLIQALEIQKKRKGGNDGRGNV